MKNFLKKNDNGFSLVELIVTVIILGILAAIAIPAFGAITGKADSNVELANDRTELVQERLTALQSASAGHEHNAGGMVLDNSGEFCWVAESLAVGANVRYGTDCVEESEFNMWAYTIENTIQLSSTSASDEPLCLTGRANGSTPVPMTLRVCLNSEHDPLGQRFVWNSDDNWQGVNSTNTAVMNSFIVNQDSIVNNGDIVSVSNSNVFSSVNPHSAVFE